MTRSDLALTAAVLFALLGVCALTWLARRERRRGDAMVEHAYGTLDELRRRNAELKARPLPMYGDERGDVLDWDPPTVPAARLNAAGGFVTISGKILHRACVDDRASGRPVECESCAGRLGMTEGAKS